LDSGSADQGWKRVELGFQPIKISSFGEDPAGELYVVDLQGGVVYRVVDGAAPAGRDSLRAAGRQARA